MLFTDHPYFERWETLLGLEKESEVHNDVQIKNAANVDGASVEDAKKVPTLDLPKNILKDSNTYISDAHIANEIEFNNYENDPEKYASIAGVPREIIEVFKGRLNTSKIVEIWISMRRTLDKYKATYEHYRDEIFKAVTETIRKYQAKKHTLKGVFNFVGCVCGFMRDRIKSALLKKIREHHELNKRAPFNYDWISAPNDAEKFTAILLGVPSLIAPTADDLPF